MKYRTLGRTGLRVSEVGFGTAPAGIENYLGEWNPSDEQNAEYFRSTVRAALDVGYTFFDSAPAYGNGRAETLLGSALEGRRNGVVLATKCPWSVGNADELETSVCESLRRLRTDFIDLIQLHGAYADRFSASDVERIINGPAYEALRRLRESGAVRYIGVSCEDAASLIPFIESGCFDTVQVKYNLAYQEAFHHTIPLCAKRNIGVLVMRPAGSGILEKYFRQLSATFTNGLNAHELSLNYVLSDRRVHSAIVGMRRTRSVERNANISDRDDLRVDLDWLHERTASATQQAWVHPSLEKEA